MSLQATLRALSDPVRRQILELLKAGKLSAGEIGAHFDITGAAISRHLAVLKPLQELHLVYHVRLQGAHGV